MNHFTEKDYQDIIRHMMDGLKKHGAKDILRQIQDLETVSVAEPAADGGERAASQFNIVLPDDSALKKAQKKGSEKYRFRPMTYQEIYCAAVDILEAYLVTGPEMTATVKKELLAGFQAEHVEWKFESENRIEGRKENLMDAFEGFIQLPLETRAEMMQIIQELKNAGGEEWV